MVSSSASITWQSWSRKWGDWTTWIRNVPATRTTEPRTRVTPENLQRKKVQTSTRMPSH
jgi:hypothetical protein